MKCSKCKNEFEEKDLQESHDIPRYIGGIDLDGRHWLCKECHKEYDNLIINKCLKFVGEKFNEEERIAWMIELSKQSKDLKLKFREIARQIKEEFFNGRYIY